MDNTDLEWINKMPRKSLPRVVVDQIKEALIRGELKPGDFLPSEKELSERLGVGKSSVREAVKMLEAIGVVKIVKGQKSRICTNVQLDALNPLTFQLIFQSHESQDSLVEFRQVIETASCRLAIKNADENNIQQLKDSYRQMEQAVIQGLSTLDLDMDFHQIIYNSTHNPFLIQIGYTVMSLFRPSLIISNHKHPEIVLADHLRIRDAFIARNPEKMEQAICESLEHWNRMTLSEVPNNINGQKTSD